MTDLHVTSRSSSFTFRDQNLDIRSIAAQLGVEHILEGSVRRAGNTVRVTAQLIEAKSDRHLWSQTYDHELSDIFAVQDEISIAIVEALKLALVPGSGSGIKPGQVVNIEAYDLYLQGLGAHRHQTVDSLILAHGFFEKVIEIEPGYAEAWYWLSRVLYDLPWPEYASRESTEAAALRAIELDPTLGGAYTVLSLVNGADSEKITELRARALALAPGDAFVVMHYGRALERGYQARLADVYFQKAIHSWHHSTITAYFSRPERRVMCLTSPVSGNWSGKPGSWAAQLVSADLSSLYRAAKSSRNSSMKEMRFALEISSRKNSCVR